MSRLWIFLLPCLFLAACGSVTEDKASQPISQSTFLRLADKAYASHDLVMAAGMYQKAMAADSADLQAHYGYAKVLMEMGNTTAAAEVYQNILKRKPDDMVAKRNMANILISEFKAVEAEKLLIDCLNVKPDGKLFNSLGIAYDLQGLTNEAQQSYHAGMILEPDSANLGGNLALSLGISGDSKSAIKLMQKITSRADAGIRQRHNLAFLYIVAGQKSLAEKILRMDMNDTDAAKVMDFYEQAASLPDPAQRIHALMQGTPNS